eukprot:scaffold2913_cov181-Ochromonas_danica.AAC.19
MSASSDLDSGFILVEKKKKKSNRTYTTVTPLVSSTVVSKESHPDPVMTELDTESLDVQQQAYDQYDRKTLDHIWAHLFACYNAILKDNGGNQYPKPHNNGARNQRKVQDTGVNLTMDIDMSITVYIMIYTINTLTLVIQSTLESELVMCSQKFPPEKLPKDRFQQEDTRIYEAEDEDEDDDEEDLIDLRVMLEELVVSLPRSYVKGVLPYDPSLLCARMAYFLAT